MDIETLTNHVARFGKRPLDIAAQLILGNVFNLRCVNVDGSGDGGTDISGFQKSGERAAAAYQLTTQKKDIANKAYRDAKKALEKLAVERFYFITTADLSETAARKIEGEIETDIGIRSYCFGARHIAGFLAEDQRLLNEFLDKANYPLPKGIAKRPDLCEMALHGLTLSEDSGTMRQGVYDDTILLFASAGAYDEPALISQVLEFLGLSEDRGEDIKRRIGALFAKQYVQRDSSGKIVLSEGSMRELSARDKIYQSELGDFAAAQTDLMRAEFGSAWKLSDSEEVSVLIANIYVSAQVGLIQETRPSVSVNSVFQLPEKGVDDLKTFLLKRGLVSSSQVHEAARKLLEISSNHPLISKIARASIYVALEGRNPITSSKALGAARWSDYNLLIDPSVALPFICDQLYKGTRDYSSAASVRAVKRAHALSIKTTITYYYINECAGHLLRARKYDGLQLDTEEMRFAPNAFVANYYAMLASGTKLPATFLDDLKTFSPAIATPRAEAKEWVRAIMTDIQSVLIKAGVEFIESPFYGHTECADFEKEYTFYLRDQRRDKSRHLINHDVWALQMTNDRVLKQGEHWLILTFDRAMIDVGRSGKYKGWVTAPATFLDLTNVSRPLSETRYRSLVHKVASYSERTLAAGARILDRVIQFASPDMQNWEFRNEVEVFKASAVKKADLEASDALQQIDEAVDRFLQSKGIEVNVTDESEMIDT